MKNLVITGIIIITILTSCEKTEVNPDTIKTTYTELTYQKVTDAIESITNLYAVQVINHQTLEAVFFRNTPESYCNYPNGRCDITIVYPKTDSLLIDYSNTLPDESRVQYLIGIAYAEIDSLVVSPTAIIENGSIFYFYMNVDKELRIRIEENKTNIPL